MLTTHDSGAFPLIHFSKYGLRKVSFLCTAAFAAGSVLFTIDLCTVRVQIQRVKNLSEGQATVTA